MKPFLYLFCILILFAECRKDVGRDPELGYSDGALLDSAKEGKYKYYKSKDTLYDGSHGVHGPFKLRFNSVAFAALSSGGKLPVGGTFPEGSFVVKDIYKNGSLSLYAWMYKHNGAWLWGEAHTDGKFIAGKKDGPNVCKGCHSQSGHRDNVVAFQFY